MSAVTRSSQVLLESRVLFQSALLSWFQQSQRSLPWRTTPSLYRTVVSEFMLQQTQVKTVLPYFSRWMEVFPDFRALAEASEERVLKNWEGLGYYSRARNLHRLARRVAAMTDIPRDSISWRELPGVGPYTAAAIVSIAFGTPESCVDGNVVRILARLTGDGTVFRDSATASKAFAPLAAALLARDAPGNHNQAMMELGATVCHRHHPHCLTCPVRHWCAAARHGEPEQFPRFLPRVTEQRKVTRLWVVEKESLLLHRSGPAARRFANMHELPTPGQLGLRENVVARGEPLVRKKRGITRYTITESIYALAEAPAITHNPELIWVPVRQLDQVTLSGPHRRWVAELLSREDSRPSPRK